MLRRMRAALFCAPVANAGAELAELLRERTVAGHGIGTQAADCSALDATARAVVVARLADHVGKTVSARIGTGVARFDAGSDGLGEMVAHGPSWFEMERPA